MRETAKSNSPNFSSENTSVSFLLKSEFKVFTNFFFEFSGGDIIDSDLFASGFSK